MGGSSNPTDSTAPPIQVPNYSLAQLFQNVKRNLHLGQ